MEWLAHIGGPGSWWCAAAGSSWSAGAARMYSTKPLASKCKGSRLSE